jgi:bifunctional DNA-binding transcriptional regulator/antitoxin component of YhaV-PrlF toxin-antitoxin module
MVTEVITLTSKRQATFPVKLCDEMGIGPGSKLVLGRHVIDGAPTWVIQNAAAGDMPWLGALKEFAADKSDDMDDVRESIGRCRGWIK